MSAAMKTVHMPKKPRKPVATPSGIIRTKSRLQMRRFMCYRLHTIRTQYEPSRRMLWTTSLSPSVMSDSRRCCIVQLEALSHGEFEVLSKDGSHRRVTRKYRSSMETRMKHLRSRSAHRQRYGAGWSLVRPIEIAKLCGGVLDFDFPNSWLLSRG